MAKVKTLVNNFSKLRPTIKLLIIVLVILIFAVGLPTLARYKNRIVTTTIVWDGSMANNYAGGLGTESNPYIITNGSELAYFSHQLITEDYANTYFRLEDDILLNAGAFNYHNNQIEYIINDQTYYVKPNTNEYYDNLNFEGTPIGNINELAPLNNFKGIFDANSYRINGLYINNQSDVEVALFTDLNGLIKDLYIENSLVAGGQSTAILASKTNNATISNVMVEGFAIGADTLINQTYVSGVDNTSILTNQSLNSENLALTSDLPLYDGTVVTTSITGNYTLDGLLEGNTTIKINNQTVTGGSFDLDLGNALLDNVSVSTIASSGTGSINFTNIKYNIVYQYGVTAGLVAQSNHSTFTNVVNKAHVFAKDIGAGLVGVTNTDLNLTHSYNLGNITAIDVAAGLIGVIEKSADPITINKSYHSATLNSNKNGGLIGIIKDSANQVNLSNVFNTAPIDYSIYQIINSNPSLTNAYHISSTNAIYSGTAVGGFTRTNLANLTNKNFLTETLLFTEFTNLNDLISNPNQVWIYEDNNHPLLLIDDLNQPIASINCGIYAWDNFSTVLKEINFNKSTSFSIEELNATNPIQNAYYYISDKTVTADQLINLDWQPYTEIVNLNQEGTFVIYAKIIDYSNNITYLNSDQLILNFPGLVLDNHKWTTTTSNLNNIYLDRAKNLSIVSADMFVNKEYYLTNQVLDQTALDGLTTEWIAYNDQIPINEVGKKIIYVKLTDENNYVKYINSDYLVYDGYQLTDTFIGRNSTSFSGNPLNITAKSNITFKFNYNAVMNDLSNISHNITTNILLPINTKITITDYQLKKTFTYQINTSNDDFGYQDSCPVGDENCQKVATYPLTLFKEVGNTTHFYVDSSYYQDGVISETFLVNFDFYNASISQDYQDIIVKLNLLDNNQQLIRPTLYNSLQPFNIYTNQSASLNLTTDFSNVLNYNVNNTHYLNFTSKLNHSYNNQTIIDSTYEDKTIGLSIKFVDEQDKVLDKSYLQNFLFKVGDHTYAPSNDNRIRINLASGISDVSSGLTIMTFTNNSDLPTGRYYLKIQNYATIDGNYYYVNELGNDIISIPVDVNNDQIKDNYGFDVLMADANRIIDQDSTANQVNFDILTTGVFTNPLIKVSLYEKAEATAYNQNYNLIDLASYTSDILSNSGNQTYIVTNNPLIYNPIDRLVNHFDLNLRNNQFNKNGYKFVFDLYDGLKKINTIEKYFVVR